jgi:carboxylesterase type B
LLENQLPSSGNKTDLLPVVVTIHMGNHFFGSGQMYEPHYMMEEDTVVITFNYRLGLFGFLNTLDNNAPGNVGLGDQSLLLAWVRENVHKFSGDWERVSLMGQSSAGLDVLLHMTNPRSKGLFHRAVVQSGTLSSCTFTRDPVAQAKKVAEQVGCPMNNSTAFVKCLKGSYILPKL